MAETLLKSQQAFGGNGWQPAKESWAYATANTITVPSGAAAKYTKGDKIKLTQTTEKLFYVVGVADTVLTITAGSSYTLTNAAITNNYYSHESSPVGWPSWLEWVPTLTLGNSDLSGYTHALFTIQGTVCHVYLYAANASMSGTAGTSIWSLPVACTAQAHVMTVSAYPHGFVYSEVTSNQWTVAKDANGGSWVANETGLFIRASGNYPI